jgi:class 3 adenylate cyclase
MNNDAEFETLLNGYTSAANGQARSELSEQIWKRYGYELSVLVLDMSGFSLLAQRHGIIHYLSMIRRMHVTARPIVESHQGEVVKFEADNCYAVFPNPMQAARAAITLNHAFAATNELTTDDLDIRIACGIDHGKILLAGGDLYGNAVNRACKLGEDIAHAGEVLITAEAMDAIPDEAQIMGIPLDLTISGISLSAYSLVI